MSFIAELKRRNVIRVAILYAVSAWLLLQVADVLSGLFSLPDFSLRFVGFLLLLGFPVALVLSWVYELTPEGVRRDSEVPPEKSISPRTAHKLNLLTIAVGGVAIALVAWQQWSATPGTHGPPAPDQAPTVEAPPASANSDDRIAIAVLPFQNLSISDDALPFANGLHDDLLTQLSRNQGLRVISRTSVLEYRETTKNVRTISEELGVSHLIEGGVQRAGDRVRVNVQLIDSTSDEHLWAETYDRALTIENIFDIQSEMAGQISRALRVSLSPEAASPAMRPTENLEAYETYLEGKLALDLLLDATPGSLRQVRRTLERAIALDPAFAQPYAKLAQVADAEYWFQGRNVGKREEALAYAQEALRLEPGLPEALQAQASIYYHGFLDYDRALATLQRTDEALRGDVWALSTRAAIERRSGNFGAGRAIFEQIVTLAPRGVFNLSDVVVSYMVESRFRDAHTVVDRIVALGVPGEQELAYRGQVDWRERGRSPSLEGLLEEPLPTVWERDWVHLPSALAARWQAAGPAAVAVAIDRVAASGIDTGVSLELMRARFGVDYDPSVLAIDLEALQARVLGGDMLPEFRLHIAEMMVYLGRDEEAIELLDAVMRDPIVTRDIIEGPSRLALAALVNVRLGRIDQAVEALTAALEANVGYSLRSLVQYPGHESLTSDPAFQALVERFGWKLEDRSRGVAL